MSPDRSPSPRRMALRRLGGLVALGLPAVRGGPAQAQTPGPNDPARYRAEEQRVPMKGGGTFGGDLTLAGTWWRPPQGEGPFPLVLLTHGSDADPAARRRYSARGYWNTVRWFLNRGYGVLYVLRPSYGDSEGPYLEANATHCEQANYGPGFESMADVLAASLQHARGLPQADASRWVLAGHSAGGAAALAFAARRPEGLAAVLNFAGGKGGGEDRPYAPCRADQIERLFADYARRTVAPSLWVYASNDLYFGGEVAPRWHAAYQGAGGPATLLMTAPAPEDKAGHHIVQRHLNLWSAPAEAFLARHAPAMRAP